LVAPIGSPLETADLSMPPIFDHPVAEPRGAAGGRSSNIIIIISVRRERPTPPQFSAVSIGPLANDPVPPALTGRRRPLHRRRRRGDHTSVPPRTPELHRSPRTANR